MTAPLVTILYLFHNFSVFALDFSILIIFVIFHTFYLNLETSKMCGVKPQNHCRWILSNADCINYYQIWHHLACKSKTRKKDMQILINHICNHSDPWDNLSLSKAKENVLLYNQIFFKNKEIKINYCV